MKEIAFMLATLFDKPFDQKGWLFEVKWDGYRAMAYKNDHVELISRGKISFNERYPSIIAELKKIPGEFLIDGEIVFLDEEGKESFQRLQNYQKIGGGNLCYYVFDILFLNGHDLRDLPLLERKHILNKLIPPRLKFIKYNKHTLEKGKVFFEKAKKLGFEGMVAKRADSPYQGKRSSDWLKVKTHMRQEVVIGGFTPPKGSRMYFGALLVGVYRGGKLHYAGLVGGGFDRALLKEVYDELKKHIAKHSPFEEKVPLQEVTWVKPKLVCEVAFAQWTEGGNLRQGVFKGLRVDKKPKEVVKEL